MNKFDDILRENVKKAFANYNSDHLADEGWKSFVEMQKGKRRRAVIIPLWARAASILLIIGLGTFLAYRLSVHQTTREIISATEPAAGRNEEHTAPVASRPAVTPVAESASETAGVTVRTKKPYPEYQPAIAADETFLKADRAGGADDNIHAILQNRSVYPDILPVPAMTLSFSELFNKSVPDEIMQEQSISAAIIFDGSGSVEESTETEKSFARRSLLAGLSGSMARSEEASPSASGLSMGLYLDQKITRRISFRPGLALAMQSFGIENENYTAGVNYPISLNDGTAGTPYAFDGQLSMLAMELPLNLVIRIFEKERSGFFVSAGTSTIFYISQQFKADVVNGYTKMELDALTGSYSSVTRYSTIEVEKDFGSFRNTDFLGLANLSAGYSFPYSKTGTLLVEPFVQLPVDDLTSLDLKIRYAGVSMKLQFGNRDKGK